MFDDCPKFQEFRAALEAEGVTIRWAWSTKRNSRARGHDDCAFAMFYGNGFQPAIATAIIVSYGKDGYGIWMDPAEVSGEGRTITGDAAMVKRGHLTAEQRATVAEALRFLTQYQLDRSTELHALADRFGPSEYVRPSPSFAKGE